jgi:hypothetical protein
MLSVVGTSFATLSTANAVGPSAAIASLIDFQEPRSSIPCTQMVPVRQQQLKTEQSLDSPVQMHMDMFLVRALFDWIIW